MTTHRRHRNTRARTEKVLGRVTRGDAHVAKDGDPVTRMLAAARADALDHETDGEQAALVAFRAAVATPVATRRRFARALTVKVTVAAAVLAGGGVAVASANGIGPGLLGGHQVGTSPSPSKSHPAPRPNPANPGQTTTGQATSHPGTPSLTAAQLVSLCQSYRQIPNGDRTRALDTPQYADLVAAADGKGHVKQYCDDLLSTTPAQQTPQPSPRQEPASIHPTHPGHPSPGTVRSPNPHSSH